MLNSFAEKIETSLVKQINHYYIALNIEKLNNEVENTVEHRVGYTHIFSNYPNSIFLKLF